MLLTTEICLKYNIKLDLCNELDSQSKLTGTDIAKFHLGCRIKSEKFVMMVNLGRNINKINSLGI